MNRNVYITMLIVFLMLSFNAGAVYRLFDNFDDKIVDLINGQDGWFATGTNAVVLDPTGAYNRVLYVPSDSSILRKSLHAENTGVPDMTSRMMFMRIRISQKQTFSVGLSFLSSPSQSDDFAPEIGMSNSAQNLDLKAWDDEGGNYKDLIQLTPDQWYNMWVWIDANDNTYEIWMNDVPGADADIVADKLKAADDDDTFVFRSGKNSDLITFYIKNAGGSSGTNFGPVYFDDVYLELSGTFNLLNPTTLQEPIPGDADFSGCVNLTDFAAMAAAWHTGPIPPVPWEDGNFDYDDAVNINDLALLAEYWLEICYGE